jgi:hypothetical protein
MTILMLLRMIRKMNNEDIKSFKLMYLFSILIFFIIGLTLGLVLPELRITNNNLGLWLVLLVWEVLIMYKILKVYIKYYNQSVKE